jgi:hypothetical protein
MTPEEWKAMSDEECAAYVRDGKPLTFAALEDGLLNGSDALRAACIERLKRIILPVLMSDYQSNGELRRLIQSDGVQP